MKFISYEDVITDAQGYPILIPDPDPVKLRELQGAAFAKGVERVFAPTITATFATYMAWFLNDLPWDRDEKGQPRVKMTHGDSFTAGKLIAAFKGHLNGHVEMDDLDYTWLMSKVDSADGAAAFRANLFVVKKRLEALVAPQEPAPK